MTKENADIINKTFIINKSLEFVVGYWKLLDQISNFLIMPLGLSRKETPKLIYCHWKSFCRFLYQLMIEKTDVLSLAESVILKATGSCSNIH